MKPILAGMIAIACIASVASGAQAQSFNCRKAYFADEKLICMSPDLSRFDERLNRIFGQTRDLLSPPGRNALDHEEERWVVARRRCGPDHRCIEDHYRSRIGELAERLGGARRDDRGEARRDDRGDEWGDARDEAPSANREGWRDVSAPERFVPEPPRAEALREPPVAPSRARPDDGERPQREEAAPPSTRYSSPGEVASPRPTRPPAAGEKRRPAPVQTGVAAQPGAAAAATAPEPPPRQRAARQPANTTPPPDAATGTSMPAPHIEFADPASGPMTPPR